MTSMLIKRFWACKLTLFRRRRGSRQGGGALKENGGGQGQTPSAQVGDKTFAVGVMACRTKDAKGVRESSSHRRAAGIQPARLAESLASNFEFAAVGKSSSTAGSVPRVPLSRAARGGKHRGSS